MQKLRLAVVADGPPEDRGTNSGVALGVLEALRAHPQVASVVPIDASLHGPSKGAVGPAVRLDLSELQWRVKYSHGRSAVRARG